MEVTTSLKYGFITADMTSPKVWVRPERSDAAAELLT